jgi:hypothetical protein
VANSVPVVVDLGPPGNFDADILFVTVTVCNPNSSTCVNIDHVAVDTGSEGLRLFQQATLNLPAVTDAGGHPVGECTVFADMSYIWGPIVRADVQMAGEKASNIPVQIMNSSTFASVPSACNSGLTGMQITSPSILGANGLIGLGVFRQDCGGGCAQSPPPASTPYYGCPAAGCAITSVSLQNQVQNPVWMFPQDNNGLLITLPAVPVGGQSTANGTMVFGIGTQSDNGLGGATVLTTDNLGNITTTFSGTPYNASFLDSGSNGIFFLDTATTGLPACSAMSNAPGFYCPNTTVGFNATNTGQNNLSAPAMFSISNATNLFNAANGTFAAFSDLGGPNNNPPEFDFGLAFFFGKTVFTGIEGQNSPGGFGPYNAY